MQVLAIARATDGRLIPAQGLGWVVLLLVMLAVPALAQSDNPYSVTGIPVSAEAENAVAARDVAIEQGKRDGLATLVERLGGGTGAPGGDIENYVSSFEVLSERVGATTYAGEIEVIYRQDTVNALLPSGPVVQSTRAFGTVVVPLWERGGEFLLWQPDNAWKNALDRNVGSGSVIVPLGDLQDVAAVRPTDAVAGNELALQRLSDRYAVGEVVVVKLVGDEVGALRIDATRFPPDAGEPFSMTVVPQPGESFEDTLARAATDAGAALAGQALARAAPAARYDLSVAVELSSLEAWGRLLRSFEDFSEVQSANVRQFSRSEAVVQMAVFGELEDLVQKFGRTGWWLNETTGVWRLQPGTPPPPIPGTRPSAADLPQSRPAPPADDFSLDPAPTPPQ